MYSFTVFSLLLLAVSCCFGEPQPYDDFHYPSEEGQEMSSAKRNIPTVTTINDASAVLKSNGVEKTVQVGDVAWDWKILALLPDDGTKDSGNTPYVVLEQLFDRWGLWVYATLNEADNILMRKSVGKLSGIDQPRFNLSDNYFTQVSSGLRDYAADTAMNLSKTGELDFEALAGTLAPQRDIASISNPEDVVKFGVTHSGRIKCGFRENTNVQNMGGITELQNQHSPLVNKQTVIFDPADYVSYWPAQYENSKTGLVGGFLNVANVGSYSANVSKGFDLVAFSPTPQFYQSDTKEENSSCQYIGPFNNTYVAGYPGSGGGIFSTVEDAEAACNMNFECGGVTKVRPSYGGHYEMRAASYVSPSTFGETSWLMTNQSKALCRHEPRIGGLVYDPVVLVRLQEEVGAPVYVLVSNSTIGKKAVNVTSTQFFKELLQQYLRKTSLMEDAMQVSLPGAAGSRQHDTVYAGIFGAAGNYIGNQSNYGYGATYWSYGREDNGSLPLNWLSVDAALVDWGFCDSAIGHLQYYLENYVELPSATINYYTWGSEGDSVADQGRLVHILLRTFSMCENDDFEKFAQPYLQAFGRQFLRERATATARTNPVPGTKNLLLGAPEHDWSGVKGDAFYNNNVWTLRGMQEAGAYLSKGPYANVTLANNLLEDATKFTQDIAASINVSVVRNAQGEAIFLPPYAHVNATPYQSMVGSHEASYANFRFYPEALLSEVFDDEIQVLLLKYHNELGGRVGGASRWSTHLDDMPTAGWGYAALASNQTENFQAFLYGHMATYQSRGTFHSTEQLSFLGTGLYRGFLSWVDPPPTQEVGETQRPETSNLLGYYAPENDVSYCIVTEILAARLSRWQLVFEDIYRPKLLGNPPSLWLARGVLKSWFTEGFSATNVPNMLSNRISYALTYANGVNTYAVTVKRIDSSYVVNLRFPQGIQANPIVVNATVVNRDKEFVSVIPKATSFSVTA
eukprot:m.118671 g.118671  ORF g.118671 m.118671 type:complete len:968 (-) comp14284_c0_seq3:101-3004(-)